MRLIHLAIRCFHFFVLVLAADLNNKRSVAYYQCPTRSFSTTFPRLENVNIEELHSLFEDGSLTSADLVHASHSP